MTKTVALLRGINVGGRNKLPMKELVAVLEGLGLNNVKTYIQSGNVVFEKETAVSPHLANQITDAIEQSHGFCPRVMLIPAAEFAAAASNNPYPEAEAAPKTLHLYFLATTPSEPDMEALEELRKESEAYTLSGKLFYLHAPEGIGRSKLAERVEKKLGVSATARNWRTVSKLLAMLDS